MKMINNGTFDIISHNVFMRFALLIVSVIICCLSCSKSNNQGKPVEIYLLKSSQIIPGKCQVNPALSMIEDNPFIQNHEIAEYSKTSYEFRLTDIGYQKIKTLGDGTPFAVTVEREVIYYGFIKPSISSSSCEHSITIDYVIPGKNKIRVSLGYPWSQPGYTIDDQRNHAKLLMALQNQNKLR